MTTPQNQEVPTTSTAFRPIKRSETESQPRLYLIGGIGFVVLFMVAVAGWVGNYNPGATRSISATETRQAFWDAATATVVAMPTVTPTVTPTPTVIEFRDSAPVTLLATLPPPTEAPTQEPQVVYYEVTREVTVDRIVEVYPTPTPTPTMQPGSVLVCVYGEGLTGIYLDESGMVGNTCVTKPLNSPVNEIRLRVTK